MVIGFVFTFYEVAGNYQNISNMSLLGLDMSIFDYHIKLCGLNRQSS